MKQAKYLKLTVLFACVVLTITSLVVYRGGFAQTPAGKPGQLQDEAAGTVEDSVALAKGMAELQKIVDHYKDASVWVNGEIRYYSNDSAGPAEKAPFTFAVQGGKTLYELDSVTTVTENNVALVVDHREQSIAVVEQEMPEQPADLQPSPEMMGAMKDFISSIAISRSEQYSQLTISFNENAPSNITQYVIVYDGKTYAVKKIKIKMLDTELTDELPGNEDGAAKISEDDELYMVDSTNNAVATGYYAQVSNAVYEIIYTQERTIQHGAISIADYVKKENEGYEPAGRYKRFSILK